MGAFNCTGGTGNFSSGLKDNGDALSLLLLYITHAFMQVACESQALSLIQTESQRRIDYAVCLPVVA